MSAPLTLKPSRFVSCSLRLDRVLIDQLGWHEGLRLHTSRRDGVHTIRPATADERGMVLHDNGHAWLTITIMVPLWDALDLPAEPAAYAHVADGRKLIVDVLTPTSDPSEVPSLQEVVDGMVDEIAHREMAHG